MQLQYGIPQATTTLLLSESNKFNSLIYLRMMVQMPLSCIQRIQTLEVKFNLYYQWVVTG
jgi:hypothetical protein